MSHAEKIRILIITPSLRCGGSEKFVSLLCNHINTQQFSVCLVVVDNTRPFYSITNSAIEVIDLKKRRVLFSLPAIKKIVRDCNPDIIFSTANHLNLYLAVFRAQFNSTIKFIAREASIVSITSSKAKMPALYHWLVKKFYPRFDRIICQSLYMQQDLVKNYQVPLAKTVVIHNAVEDPAPAGLDIGKKERPFFKFITIARLSEEKGIERLIHAAGLLSIPFQYHIIGDGTKKAALQNLVNELNLQEKVFFAGEKADPFEGMDDADLLLIGSYYEGFPNVLLEAGVRGIPAVAFNAPGGIAEILNKGNNGFLVDDNDIIGFAATVNTALDTGFNRYAIRGSTLERFSVNLTVNAIETLFTMQPK